MNGTDKQSNHNYGDAYAALIEATFSDQHVRRELGHAGSCKHAREEVRLVMEVGVADGACLRAWQEVFPNAKIVGMDIHPSAQATGDIEFHLGDVGNKRCCDRAAAARQFDLIVEDATHHLVDTMRGLLYLWPYVRPGGLYVVEEWDGIHELRDNIKALWPHAEVINTEGPFGGVEPLVAFKKPT